MNFKEVLYKTLSVMLGDSIPTFSKEVGDLASRMTSLGEELRESGRSEAGLMLRSTPFRDVVADGYVRIDPEDGSGVWVACHTEVYQPPRLYRRYYFFYGSLDGEVERGLYWFADNISVPKDRPFDYPTLLKGNLRRASLHSRLVLMVLDKTLNSNVAKD